MSMDPPGIGCSVSTGPYPSTPISCERSTLMLLSFRYRRPRCSLVLVSAAAKLVALSVISSGLGIRTPAGSSSADSTGTGRSRGLVVPRPWPIAMPRVVLLSLAFEDLHTHGVVRQLAGELAHQGGLSGAALLGNDSDHVGHGLRTVADNIRQASDSPRVRQLAARHRAPRHLAPATTKPPREGGGACSPVLVTHRARQGAPKRSLG